VIERNIEKIANEVVARFSIECNAAQHLLAYELSFCQRLLSYDLTLA
jgi:hypothetical protein